MNFYLIKKLNLENIKYRIIKIDKNLGTIRNANKKHPIFQSILILSLKYYFSISVYSLLRGVITFNILLVLYIVSMNPDV